MVKKIYNEKNSIDMEHSNIKSVEVVISNAMDSLKNNCNDQMARKILLSNLNFCKDNGLMLIPPFCNKLTDFISYFSQNINNLIVSTTEGFTEICKILQLILNFEDLHMKIYIIRDLLHDLIKTSCLLLKLLDKDNVSNDERVIRYIIVIEIILKSPIVYKMNDEVFFSIESIFEELIINALLSNYKILITYSLSLLQTYKNAEYTNIVERIWLSVVFRAVNERCYEETFLIVSSYFIDYSIKRRELVNVLNTEEFWIVLRQCLKTDLCCQKYVFNILKFSIFNLCDDENCRNNHASVWNCCYSKNYLLWWKTYFVIIECMKEKQVHIVLPVFPLIDNLINDRTINKNFFWICQLLQCGLRHDSRTIRIKTIFCLFQMKTEVHDEDSLLLIIRILLNSINDSALYRKILKDNEFDNFKNKFVDWITNFTHCERKICFYELFLQVVCELKWSSIPLYYILVFIVEIKITPCLDIKFGKVLNNIIPSITRFHNILIRSAIQCLLIKLLTHLYKCNSDSLSCFFHLLNNFNNDECLLRNTHTWYNIINFLKNSFIFQDAEKFISNRIQNQIECNERSSDELVFAVARDVLLFHDAFEILEKGIIKDNFKKILRSFANTSQKPYSNMKVQDNYLKFLVYICNITQNKFKVKCYFGSNIRIIKLIEANFINIVSYIVNRMMKSENNLELLNFYEFCLDKFTECNITFSEENISLINQFLHEALIVYSTGKLETVLCSTKVILCMCKIILPHDLKLIDYKNFQSIQLMIIKYFDKKQSYFSKSFNTSLVYSYTDAFWNIMGIFLKNDYELNKFVEIPMIFEVMLDTLDSIRKENLIQVMKALKYLFSNNYVLEHQILVFRMIHEISKRLEEIETTSFYPVCFEYWIQIFCQKSLLKMTIYHSIITEHVYKVLEKISENCIRGYRYVILILNELRKIDDLFDVYPVVSNLLIDIFSISHIQRKDQRIEKATMDHIRSAGDNISCNQIVKLDSNYSSEEMRLIALDTMLKLNEEKEKYTDHCVKFIKLLTISENNSKNRYFNNSVFHRIKHKKLQLLLIFETILYRKVCLSNLNLMEHPTLIYCYVINCLLLEPHQPSIKYMLEWLLIRLNVHYPSYFLSKFWNSFSEATEERMGCICSFISVVFHLVNIFQEKVFMDKAMKFILPWTMSQHFMARLYAQTVLMKLISANNHIKEKYEIVWESLNCSIKKGNVVKNSLKMQQDFYFSSFQPMDHFSLQTILWDLPRLANICREEWISEKLYLKYISHQIEDIPIFNSSDIFSHLTSACWITKFTETSTIEKMKEKSIYFTEMQKKFIPADDTLYTDNKNKSNNLIIIASLIDKATNLGGLTRTCEIFNVSTLVINDYNVIRNKEFTSLSITAEKHVHLVEVKQQHLFDYLKQMKEEQFFIIGAEQTTNSKSLLDFTFPLKSVLLLGNEKEGIPANLLSVLDICVEIPQMGVIRSLNVHVSAAIFLWEYSKRYLF